MSKEISKIIQIYERLLDYFYSGTLSFVVLKTLREQIATSKNGVNSQFVIAIYLSSYNTIVLALANTMKPRDDSINLNYLFNSIRSSEKSLGEEIHKNLTEFLSEFESALQEIDAPIQAALVMRDTTVAHLDRRHINNPAALTIDPPVKWDDLERAYDIIGSGLLRIGKLLGLSHIEDHTTLANFFLANQTRMVFNFLSHLNENSSRNQ
ncbi:MAG: hypothetical protein HS100_20305 [Anaerolineales bacterium]|nr:hypothetical protein [Anaerolineales bacterium]